MLSDNLLGTGLMRQNINRVYKRISDLACLPHVLYRRPSPYILYSVLSPHLRCYKIEGSRNAAWVFWRGMESGLGVFGWFKCACHTAVLQ